MPFSKGDPTLAPGRLCFCSLGFQANTCFHSDVGDPGLAQVPTCISNSIMLCSFKIRWCQLKSLKKAHPQRCLGKGEVARVGRFRSMNLALSRQADRLSLQITLACPHPPTAGWANPKSQRGSDERPSTVLHTPERQAPSHQQPNVASEIMCFPLPSFPPALQLASGTPAERALFLLIIWQTFVKRLQCATRLCREGWQ